MGAWDDYRGCCRSAAARDPLAGFCPECGHPLFRCPTPGCVSLLTPLGHCPSCVGLQLSLEKGAYLTARAGDCLTVPFVLANLPNARPLSIKSVLRDGASLQQAAVPVPWDQLGPGQARTLAVEVGPFPHGGLYSLRLTIVVGLAPGDIEEVHAFTGEVAIDVEGRAAAAPNVHLEHAELGTGAGVYVVHEGAPAARRSQADAVASRTEVRLERAERFEVQQGHRGYDRIGARLPRNVPFAFVGFPDGDRPPDGPLVQRPMLRCGRNGRQVADGTIDEANDLCLRAYRRNGELDREASTGISRRACDLVLANDRLYARAVGRQGLALNGERFEAGEARAAGHGDVIEVPAGSGRAMALEIGFKVSAGLVTQVRVEKTAS